VAKALRGGKKVKILRGMNRAAAPGRGGVSSPPIGDRLCAFFRSGDEGQSLIEFALVVPIMLLLLTGVMVFAFTMYDMILLQTAASQGVQVLALSQNVPGITDPCASATTAISRATRLNSSAIGITFLNGGTNGTVISAGNSNCVSITKGTELTVTLTYPCSYALIYKFNKSCQLTASESEPAQ
jgi:Flp pilus assembly protein TadG